MSSTANLMKMKKTKPFNKAEAENTKDSKPRQFADEKERLGNRDRKNELGEYTVVCMEEGCEYSGRPSGLRIHMLEEHEKRVAYA